jgi:hypothetical protein
MTKLATRYIDRLRSVPDPGQGRHTAILGIANLGVTAGVPPDRIHADIQNATRSAPMPDREIGAAIAKAAFDHRAGNGVYQIPPKPVPIIKNGQIALRRIIEQATISNEADLFDVSPIRLPYEPLEDACLLLSVLFAQDDQVFIGDRLEASAIGKNIRSVGSWCDFFRRGGTAGPHIIVNPLSGVPAPKKDGEGRTYRGDANVKTFRHCLVEFDNLPREDQIRFWSAAKLPLLALIDSGGKSVHAWLDVSKLSNVSTVDQWHQDIKMGFYDKVLSPLGVDRACSNPSRLSRLPGYFRNETGKLQRLLWLSKDGREVLP